MIKEGGWLDGNKLDIKYALSLNRLNIFGHELLFSVDKDKYSKVLNFEHFLYLFTERFA